MELAVPYIHWPPCRPHWALFGLLGLKSHSFGFGQFGYLKGNSALWEIQFIMCKLIIFNHIFLSRLNNSTVIHTAKTQIKVYLPQNLNKWKNINTTLDEFQILFWMDTLTNKWRKTHRKTSKTEVEKHTGRYTNIHTHTWNTKKNQTSKENHICIQNTYRHKHTYTFTQK